MLAQCSSCVGHRTQVEGSYGRAATPIEHRSREDEGLVQIPNDVNFFVVAVDGRWHGGWFRIRDGKLEVYSAGQMRSASVQDTSLDDTRDMLREMLLEMARQSSADDDGPLNAPADPAGC